VRTLQRWLAVTIVALLFVSVQPFGALASPGSDTSDRQPGLDDVAPHHDPTELIVRLRSDLPASSGSPRLSGDENQIPSAGLLARQVEGGLSSRKPLTARGDLHLFSFTDAPAADDAFQTLKDDPSVEFVEPNYSRELHWVPDSEEHFADQQWWIETMQLPDTWNVTTGDPEIVVAVIDSGVSPTHPDLLGKLVPGYNAMDGSDNSVDVDGHGTRVAGIIAAAGDNGVGTAGVAMDVRIMPIRVLADDRSISVASIYDAIVWAVDNGADLINLSLGSDKASETERSAVQYAYNNNVPVLASAGNQFNRISYPASYPESIAVGSLDAEGNRSRFSSIITTVDVAAPGELLFSPAWNPSTGDYWSDRLGNGRPVEGTSFSTAIVSGVVALQKSINPGITVEEVRSILTSTALDTGMPGPESGVGAGQVNAEAAVRTVAYWAMYDTWYPTDFPVSTGSVVRTWLWGTDPPGGHAYEEYQEAQHNVRLVYYYDKSRMEITHPMANRSERWYITNGLLVNELISGDMQLGDAVFVTRQPADVNVAGDPDDILGPTYASFSSLLDIPPLAQGQVIIETLSRAGEVGADERFAVYDVWAEYLEETTNHRVADVFWDYLNSVGPVAAGDDLITDRLFDPWFYATGLPITEAYWSEVTVAGQVHDVLMQCFERRCMTYTPDNEPAWRVEMGNVGLHYYAWRYETDHAGPVPVEPVPVEPPAAEVLYVSTLEEWPEATVSGGATFVQDEAYHILVTESGGFSLPQMVPDTEFGDISATVEIRGISGTGESEACLILHADPGVISGYLWCIDGAGETVAYYHGMDAEGSDTVDVLLERSLRGETNPAGEWNTLGIETASGTFNFEINLMTVGVHEQPGASSGAVGIAVTNSNDVDAEYAFRNLTIMSYIIE
jgi:thermitase